MQALGTTARAQRPLALVHVCVVDLTGSICVRHDITGQMPGRQSREHAHTGRSVLGARAADSCCAR